jgi:hypothetical protein
MKMLHILILVAVVVITGCASTTKMNNLSVGMTKKEVISVMGSPGSTAAPRGGAEILRYELRSRQDILVGGFSVYFVRLIDGKVDSYGKLGDFDSAKDPTINYNIKSR